MPTCRGGGYRSSRSSSSSGSAGSTSGFSSSSGRSQRKQKIQGTYDDGIVQRTAASRGAFTEHRRNSAMCEFLYQSLQNCKETYGSDSRVCDFYPRSMAKFSCNSEDAK